MFVLQPHAARANYCYEVAERSALSDGVYFLHTAVLVELYNYVSVRPFARLLQAF